MERRHCLGTVLPRRRRQPPGRLQQPRRSNECCRAPRTVRTCSRQPRRWCSIPITRVAIMPRHRPSRHALQRRKTQKKRRRRSRRMELRHHRLLQSDRSGVFSLFDSYWVLMASFYFIFLFSPLSVVTSTFAILWVETICACLTACGFFLNLAPALPKLTVPVMASIRFIRK